MRNMSRANKIAASRWASLRIRKTGKTCCIMSTICSIWVETRGWWVGRRHWRSVISFKYSWQKRSLKCRGFSFSSLARRIICKHPHSLHELFETKIYKELQKQPTKPTRNIVSKPSIYLSLRVSSYDLIRQ